LKRIVAGLAFVIWLVATLDLLTIRQTILENISNFLTYPIPLGKAQLPPGKILTFVLILILGFLISRTVRFVLREDVFSRMPLQQGVPSAMSTLIHYLFLVIVLIMALAALGMEWSQLTLLTGALGVGIGFGLQSVVNNFVSGLILLFERPIREGDVVEVDTIIGEVRRVGMRSSTVATFQGAEVVLPNSILASQRLVNWTLSARQRRVDITVGVQYGSDIPTVRELLTNVAATHPDVLRQPKPVAFFLDFGESALQFQLCFWVPRFDVHMQMKSEVAAKVAAALQEAGIAIPFPQRDLHITSSPFLKETARLGADPPNPSPGKKEL